MAVVILHPKNPDKKPKKDYINLAEQHRKHKMGHLTYMVLFYVSLMFNIILLISTR